MWKEKKQQAEKSDEKESGCKLHQRESGKQGETISDFIQMESFLFFFFFSIHRDEEFGTIFTFSIISALIKSETRFNARWAGNSGAVWAVPNCRSWCIEGEVRIKKKKRKKKAPLINLQFTQLKPLVLAAGQDRQTGRQTDWQTIYSTPHTAVDGKDCQHLNTWNQHLFRPQ